MGNLEPQRLLDTRFLDLENTEERPRPPDSFPIVTEFVTERVARSCKIEVPAIQYVFRKARL